jgi:MFS family permease
MPALRYRGWWVMLGCIACQMDLGFAKDGMDVYMTFIVAELGWGRADFQVAGWALLATYGVTSPAIGWLLDRLGPRTVLTLGAVLVSLTYAGYALMTGFTHYLLVTPLLGIGLVALGDIPVSTVAARWFERHRGTVLGIVLIGSNIGASIVNLLAKSLYRAYGDDWRPAALTLAVIMAALVLPFSLWVVRDPRPGEVPPDERTAPPAAPGAPAFHGLRLGEAAATPNLWLLAFALFAYYFYYLFANRHIIAFLRDQDSFGYTVPAVLIGAFGVAREDFPELTKSLFEVVGLPAKIAVGWLIDRYRVRHALAWNFALLAAGSALFPLLGRLDGVMWPFIVLHGLGWGVQQVLTPLAIADCFGVRHMGQIYGTVLLVLFPAQLGPWLAGRVFDAAGSYDAFFPWCIALNVLAAAALFRLRPRAA